MGKPADQREREGSALSAPASAHVPRHVYDLYGCVQLWCEKKVNSVWSGEGKVKKKKKKKKQKQKKRVGRKWRGGATVAGK